MKRNTSVIIVFPSLFYLLMVLVDYCRGPAEGAEGAGRAEDQGGGGEEAAGGGGETAAVGRGAPAGGREEGAGRAEWRRRRGPTERRQVCKYRSVFINTPAVGGRQEGAG